MHTRTPHPFGDLLRQYRSRKSGLTQVRLAHAMGYDEAECSRLYRGWQKAVTRTFDWVES
jgi:plasmid maintenance system antidote protein VapI